MDCGNYSYAPTMLDGDSTQTAYFENDDMYSEVTFYARHYWVYAMSYDGTLEISGCFKCKETAVDLHNFIVANFADTPPESNDNLRMYVELLESLDKQKWSVKHD